MRNDVFIFRTVTITLAVVIVSVVVFLLYGLIDPRVNNDKIFAILGPAFQTIIGAFVGVLSGLVVTRKGR